ncbi:MAG: hypothetical protein AMJ90_01690 [candidate division Zixibacteria bacterium SM23_73_2]|nr:MAG: hypothetical protein AMJ90_01690 [candidate division Zixibacteria bacterium SM23_73_2]
MRFHFFTFLILFFWGFAFPQEVLDRIVAVVGDKIILESELESQYLLYSSQPGTNIKDPQEERRIKERLLEQMINDKLILIRAEQDTLLEVTAEEVENAVEQQIKSLKEQFPSEDAFTEELLKEGLTERELKRKYRSQIKSQLLMEKLISMKLSGVGISSREVRDFHQAYKDSIPEQEEAVRLSHILFSFTPSTETRDFLSQKAEVILKRAEEGDDFASLAGVYSDDPTRERGGDLGFFKKGDLLPEFERVAFSLDSGEVGLAETNLGYHIIKVERKTDSLVSARHILISVRPSSEDSARTWSEADSVYQMLKAGGDFTGLAREFSNDEESKKVGGELGWYPLKQLEGELKDAIIPLKKGEISRPFLTEFGIHIVKVLDRQSERKITLEDDWDTIKEMAKRKKTNQKVMEWLEKLKEKYYVEVRLEK